MNLVEVLNRMTMGRAVMLGLVIAAVYYFIVFDQGRVQQGNIASGQAQVQELQTKVKDIQAKLDRAAVYKKTAAEIGTTINRLLGVIPEKFGMSDLMRIVSNEAKVAGSSLSDISPGNQEISTVAKEFEELNVKLDVSGSFLQHMVFLSNLTKISQILIVRRFDMSMAHEAKGEDAAVVKMTADIVAYRYRGTLSSESGKPVNQ